MAESNLNPEQEGRKRRTKRIVQAVPLTVTGVDALGRPFQERTSTLTINCQGCRYQSKHYVLKNMWVTLEVPHNEPGRQPRTVRGRVTWIQRPRTVRELFQIAVELEISGNVWGVAFPPSDWFPFPDAGTAGTAAAPPAQPQPQTVSAQPEAPRVEAPEAPPAPRAFEPEEEKPRVISIDGSKETKDTSQQLAQQVSRLVNEAREQIQSAARDSANQAVAAETRMLLGDLHEQLMDAAKKAASAAVTEQLQSTRTEAPPSAQQEPQINLAALREEIARELRQQLGEARQQIDAQLAELERARQAEFEQRIQNQLHAATQKVETLTRALAASENEARVAMEQLRLSSEQAATNELRLWQEQMDQRSADAQARIAQMEQAAKALREQIAAAAALGETGLRGTLDAEMEIATARWRERIDTLLSDASRMAAENFEQSTQSARRHLEEQLQQEISAAAEAQTKAASEAAGTLSMFRTAIDQEIARGEATFAQLQHAVSHLESKSRESSEHQLEAASRSLAERGQAILDTQSAEMAHRAESVVNGMAERFRSDLENAARKTVDDLLAELQNRLAPQIAKVEESTSKLVFDSEQAEKALSDHQERVWQASDRNLQHTVSRGKELLAQIESEFTESARESIVRWVNEVETKATETTQSTFEALYKSADWYEKKVQNQMQTTLQKGVEQAAAQLREKAAELSGLFASELDHTSRSYVEHAQGQIQESAAEAAERISQQLAESSDAAGTLFQERAGQIADRQFEAYAARTNAAFEQNVAHMEANSAQIRAKLEGDARGFAVEFQRALSQHVQQTLAQGIQEMASEIDQARESLQNDYQALQKQFRTSLDPLGVAAIDEHKRRLENASNAWLLTTVTKLTQQSEARVEELAQAAERKLKSVCTAVINEMGATLRQRISGLTAPLNNPGAPPSKEQK